MTEQEFRKRLKRAAQNDGLSAERQMQVLARREGEDEKVRNWGRMKYLIVMAVILALGMTGAVASDWGWVDWNGEPWPPVQTSPPYMAGMHEHFEEPEKWHIFTLRSIQRPEGMPEDNGGIGAIIDRCEAEASTVEELKTWVEAEEERLMVKLLPWPVKLPDGYDKLDTARTHYVCDMYGEYEMISQEVSEDGIYLKSLFKLPEEHALMDQYSLILQDDKGQELEIQAELAKLNQQSPIFVREKDSTKMLNIEGVEQAIAIESSAETIVALRCELPYSIQYKTVEGIQEGEKHERMQRFECLEIRITGQGTPADLLAIFGLEAK